MRTNLCINKTLTGVKTWDTNFGSDDPCICHWLTSQLVPAMRCSMAWCIASSRSRTLPLGWWWAFGDATASRQFFTSCAGFQCGSASSSKSTRRCLGTFPATWLTAAVSAPTFTEEDCAQLRLICFLSVGRGPTSATVQLDLESGNICRRTLNIQTCHTTVLDLSEWNPYLTAL